MSRRSVVALALGLPVNAQRSPDPEIRRAYWREITKRRRNRAKAARHAARDVCTYGGDERPCGGRLELVRDRLGRVSTHCPACARRLAGICRDCPRKVAGTVGKAWRCAEHKDAAIAAKRAARFAWDGDRIRKRNVVATKKWRKRRKAQARAILEAAVTANQAPSHTRTRAPLQNAARPRTA